MTTVSDEILAEMVQTIVQEVDPERIYLFGSRARGNERADSDVDLCRLREINQIYRRFRLFVFPRTLCSLPVMSLPNGGPRSTM